MNHLKMDFVQPSVLAVATNTQQYSLTCVNDSAADWIFYVYQKMPNQPSDIFSLAWFASPYKIVQGGSITFTWGIDYTFVWANTGTLQPGVTFSAGQQISASPSGNNQTTFSLNNNAPQLSPATSGGQAGSLTINEASNVPNNVFSTGIGMSGQGTFLQQALQNTTQVYTPEPRYYVAAGTSVQMGQVLAETVTMTAEITFQPNVYSLKATLTASQTWDITSA